MATSITITVKVWRWKSAELRRWLQDAAVHHRVTIEGSVDKGGFKDVHKVRILGDINDVMNCKEELQEAWK